MDDLFQPKGDQLFVLQSSFSDRAKRMISVVIATMVMGSLAAIPLLAIARDSLFFRGLAILAWTVCAAALGRTLMALVTERGIVFDRERGTALVWRTRIGRRRETVHSLRPFDSLHLSTWLKRMEGTRGGYKVRVYAVELRGPQATLPLEEIPDAKGHAASLADFLKLPMVVHDEGGGVESGRAQHDPS